VRLLDFFEKFKKTYDGNKPSDSAKKGNGRVYPILIVLLQEKADILLLRYLFR
jgi:hypothetical protein